MNTNKNPFRLPRSVIPSHYEIELEPNLKTAKFSGSVVIQVELKSPSSTISLNANELNINQVTISGDDGFFQSSSNVVLSEAEERAHLVFPTELPKGNYNLSLGFTGVLNDKLRGFYRSTFTDTYGVERTIATTQFESTDARRAFPCFDEPDFKATFGISLLIADDLFAVSNGPVIREKSTGKGNKKVQFGKTMKMSTYLVAFVIGPFEATDPVNIDGIPLRIIHPVGKGHLTGYAIDVGTHALRFFTNYYGIKYPGEKLDMVAVPDFAFGAMENLGCITYREVLLLLDKNRSTQQELLRVAEVIAHEIAHMWFGDLVTMRWWNGIWLNEAFATFMATTSTDDFNPEWDRWTQFSLDKSSAFDVDSLEKTRPIEYQVNSPQDADGMFDLLTYEKGGAVLRMLEQYLGEEQFRKGIRHYLNTHKYENTETSDLWDAIEKITNQPARRIMDSWIFQGGYPLVMVERDSAPHKIKFSQRRFRYAPSSKGKEVWPIPIRLRYGSNEKTYDHSVLFEDHTMTLTLEMAPDWLVVNAGGSGFYRVQYSESLLRDIQPRLMQDLDAIERYQLVDDTWAAVISGVTEASDFLEFANGFESESDLDVWTVLIGCFSSIDRLLEGEAKKKFGLINKRLYGPVLDRLGWEPIPEDSLRDLELRGLLIRSMVSLTRDPLSIERARNLHNKYLDDPSSVEPNIAAAVAASVAINGSSADYQIFVERFKKGITPQEERRYQMLLGAFPGDNEMSNTLQMTLNGDIRTQDAPYLLSFCLSNREQGPTVWSFIRDNWNQMIELFPDTAIVRMIGGIRSLTTKEISAEIEEFFKENSVPTGELTLSQTLEKLRVNVAFKIRESQKLKDYLS